MTQQIPPPGPERDMALAEALGGEYRERYWVRLGGKAFIQPSTDDHTAQDLVKWLTTREPAETRWGIQVEWLTGSVAVWAWPTESQRPQVPSAADVTFAAALTEAILGALKGETP